MRKISFYSFILLWSLWSVLVGSNPQTLELHSDEELCSEVEFSIIPVEERISTRTFPSVYQAGSPVWIEGIPLMERFRDPKLVPSHDLLIAGAIHYGDGRRIEVEFNPLLEDVILVKGVPQERHRYYHGRNPNFVSLYWWDFFVYKPGDAARGDLFPDEESKYWMTDRDGNRIPYSHSGSNFYVNFLDPEVQEILIRKGVSIASCGIFDGIMVDNFGRGPGFVLRGERLKASEKEIAAAVIHIFSEIRARVPDDFIIIVNGAGPTLESLSELINGTHIEFTKEPGRYYNYEDLSRLENALRWNEANLRHPQVNGVMSDGLGTEHPNSKNNNRWMRVFTTLTLTHSDAYVLHNTGFPDTGEGSPNEHYWYNFWDAPLGKPVGEKAQRYKNRKGVSIEGIFIREFTNGWAVYNRSGKTRKIQLPEKVSGVASGIKNKRWHTIPDLDGEIFLKQTTSTAETSIETKNL